MDQTSRAVLQAGENKKQVGVVPTGIILPEAACQNLWMHLLFQKQVLVVAPLHPHSLWDGWPLFLCHQPHQWRGLAWHALLLVSYAEVDVRSHPPAVQISLFLCPLYTLIIVPSGSSPVTLGVINKSVSLLKAASGDGAWDATETPPLSSWAWGLPALPPLHLPVHMERAQPENPTSYLVSKQERTLRKYLILLLFLGCRFTGTQGPHLPLRSDSCWARLRPWTGFAEKSSYIHVLVLLCVFVMHWAIEVGDRS